MENSITVPDNTENVAPPIEKVLPKPTDPEDVPDQEEHDNITEDEAATEACVASEETDSTKIISETSLEEAKKGSVELGIRQPRVRQQVQRFSESLSKRFEDEQAAKDKAHGAVEAQLSQGQGTPLGEIPLIEAAIKKWKPVDLKTLHHACFGRLGAVNAVRSHLRKFSGFGFDKTDEEYSKREQTLLKKSVKEIQNALRQLNLEVSGTRAQIVTRLLEFLLKPTANVVKYKGKLLPSKRKSSVRKSSSGEAKSTAKKYKKETKTMKKYDNLESARGEDDQSDVSSAENEEEGSSVAEEEDENTEKEDDKEEIEEHAEDSDYDYKPSGKSGKKKQQTKKRSSSKGASLSPPAKKRRVKKAVESSDEEAEERVEEKEKNTHEKTKESAKSDDEEDDDDAPLSKMVASAKFPTDEELTCKVKELLKVADLNAVSMKVIRTNIADHYNGVDLSSKKQFINDVIKEYLSSSM